MNSYKQIKALEFVSCMEEFALEKKMKQRILDRIRKLKGSLEKELSDLEVEHKVLEVDEIANYISQQFFKENKSEIVIDEMTTISLDEIKERIEEILQECHRGNESMKNSYINNQQSYIMEAAQKMRDFSNIKANYKEVQNSRFFCERFERIGMNLNRQIKTSLSQFSKGVFQNFDLAVGKLKNMLAYIQDERIHKRKREMYNIYDTRRSQIYQENQSKINTIDCGGDLIRKFGEQHIKEIDNIIKKQKKKTLFVKLLPLLIVSVLIIAPRIGGWIGEQVKTISEMNQSNISEEKVLDKNILDYEMEDVFDTVGRIKKIMNEEDSKEDESGLKIILIIILGIIYFIYIKIANKNYKKNICNEVGLYMTSEIELFWKENSIENLIKEAFQIQQESLEISYREIIEKLLNSKNENIVQTLNEQERFLKLREEWNDIKRLVE